MFLFLFLFVIIIVLVVLVVLVVFVFFFFFFFFFFVVWRRSVTVAICLLPNRRHLGIVHHDTKAPLALFNQV